MARPLRLTPPEGIHHVGHYVQARRELWLDDADCRAFLELLDGARARHGIKVLSWCLMSTHYHLLIQDPASRLSSAMRDLNGGYAQHRNRREQAAGDRRARGAMFAGRFWSSLVQTEGRLHRAVRYLALNPVKDGLCEDPAEWRWSSHRLLSGHGGQGPLDEAALLAFYGGRRSAYLASVADPGAPRLALEDVGVDGDHEFARRHLPSERPSPEVPRRFLHAARTPLDDLLEGGRDPRATARAARAEGYLLREIAEALGRPLSTVARWTAGEKNQT